MSNRNWNSTEEIFLKNGIIPQGRNYNSCKLFCIRKGIKFPGIKAFRDNRKMIDKNSTVVLSAIERCPPDIECGIAKKPAWNIGNAANMLGVCVQTLRNWVAKAKNGEGNIPFYQKTDNSPIYFPIRELVAWDEKKEKNS
jgi:hypothetical protein